MNRIKLSDSYYLIADSQVFSGTRHRFSSRFEVISFLRRYCDDPYTVRKLRSLLAQETGKASLLHLDDHAVLERLGWRVVSGKMNIVRIAFRAFPSGGGSRSAHASLAEAITEDEEEFVPVVRERRRSRENQPVSSSKPTFDIFVRLPISRSEAAGVDDTFTLLGGVSIEQKQYEQSITTDGDTVDGDDCVDLVFTDLIPDLKYWLEVDPGKDRDKYYAFEMVAWGQIKPVARPK